MRVVHKFRLDPDHTEPLTVPGGLRGLHLAVFPLPDPPTGFVTMADVRDAHVPWAWVEVDTTEPASWALDLIAVGTGREVPDGWDHFASCTDPVELVGLHATWHGYARRRVVP